MRSGNARAASGPPRLVAILVAVVALAGGCIYLGDAGLTLWLENDTEGEIVIYGHGANFTLEPGEALDVVTVLQPVPSRFAGERDGVQFEFVIDTGKIGRYEDPNAKQEFRIPLSRYLP